MARLYARQSWPIPDLTGQEPRISLPSFSRKSRIVGAMQEQANQDPSPSARALTLIIEPTVVIQICPFDFSLRL